MNKKFYYGCLVVEFLIAVCVAIVGWIIGEITQLWSITIIITTIGCTAILKDATKITIELMKELEED